MNDWKEATLSDVATYTTGRLNSNAEIKNGTYPFFTCSPETLRIDKFAFDTEALILAGNNANGVFSLKYYKGKFNAYQRTYIISIKNIQEADYKFLYYALKTQLANLEFISHGTATKYLTLPLLNQIPIPLPPFPEQCTIATVLSSLDDKIDLLHRQNKTLEAMAETLFRQWFVEEVEEGWEEGCISELIDVLSGFAFKSGSFTDIGQYRLITIKAVQDGYLELSNADRIADIPARMPEYCHLSIGDILLSLTGNVGRCCLVDDTGLLLNQRVAKLQPKNIRDFAFAYILFRQRSMRTTLEEMAKGTAQANLSPIDTSRIKFIIPPDEVLEDFASEVNPVISKVIKNKIQNRTLIKLRDTLLPKLMSGEVRVAV